MNWRFTLVSEMAQRNGDEKGARSVHLKKTRIRDRLRNPQQLKTHAYHCRQREKCRQNPRVHRIREDAIKVVIIADEKFKHY